MSQPGRCQGSRLPSKMEWEAKAAWWMERISLLFTARSASWFNSIPSQIVALSGNGSQVESLKHEPISEIENVKKLLSSSLQTFFSLRFSCARNCCKMHSTWFFRESLLLFSIITFIQVGSKKINNYARSRLLHVFRGWLEPWGMLFAEVWFGDLG